jgi:MFS family permease
VAGRRSVLLTCSLLQFLVIGAQYTFPVLYLRIVEEFGAPRAAVSGVQSTVFLVETAAFVVAGLLVDRYRPLGMIALGLALMVTGLGAAAGARALWHLYVTLGAIATAGAPLVKIGVAIVLTEVFAARRRGLAFGLAYAANGLAEAAVFPIVDAFAQAWGWRAAYGMIAAALALVGWPVARSLRGAAPVAAGGAPADPADRRMLRGLWPAIGLLGLSNVFIGLNTEAAYQHFIPHVVTVGFTLSVGVWMLAVASLGHAAGMAAGGWLSDHVGRARAVALASVPPALAALTALLTTSRAALFAVAFAWGAGTGGMISARSAAWGDVFQGRRQGFVTGLLLPTYNLGAAVIAWYGGFAFDRTGAYRWPFVLAAGAAVLAPALFAAALRRATASAGARSR